jgi:K+/H+ antiporter YhaU regulatory subunit KhtT
VSTITGILTLLMVIVLGFIIMRVATVALMLTGVSEDMARFQARSAFTGCGFTTRESESIVDHPVRRHITMILMILGNGTVVMAISSLIPVFVNTEGGYRGFLSSLVWLGVGIAVLAYLSKSSFLDRHLTRTIGWALRKLTRLDVYDYHGMLHFSEGYTVSELTVDSDHWLTGKNLTDTRLSDEGIQILGIHRGNGHFIGTPTGATYIRSGDRLILYGREESLDELNHRAVGAEGDRAHEVRRCEQLAILQAQNSDRQRTREAGAEGEGSEFVADEPSPPHMM